MEIAKTKAIGSIERGGWLGTEYAMWRGIGACRWSVGTEITLVVFHQAKNVPKCVSQPSFQNITLTPKQYFRGTTSMDWKSSLVEWNEVAKVTSSTYCGICTLNIYI